MKKGFVLVCFLVLACSFSRAKDIQAYMRNCIFLSSDNKPYIETGLTIQSHSLRYVKMPDKLFQATVQVTIFYRKDTAIVKTLKYLLASAPVKDTSDIKFDLLNLKRVVVPEGDYLVQVLMRDFNDSSSYGYLSEAVSARVDEKKVAISDIELVSNYSASAEAGTYFKNGYEIKPYTSAYYPTTLNKLSFYTEIYNTENVFKDKPYLISYSIREKQTNQQVDNFYSCAKERPGEVGVILSGFDIATLPTGNYFLRVEVRSDKNELVAMKLLSFQRSNEKIFFDSASLKNVVMPPSFSNAISPDSVYFFVESLHPIANNDEVNYLNSIKKTSDSTVMEKFLYQFWNKHAPAYPLAAWKQYLAQVYLVEANYKTATRHGYQTDRGRVYLQYGPPNNVVGSESEPGAYPYQIWHYYTLPPKQGNVKFVFYDPDLVTNAYRLIYSDAQGETKDPRWKYRIMDNFKEQNGFGNIDNTAPTRDIYGSRLNELFDE